MEWIAVVAVAVFLWFAILRPSSGRGEPRSARTKESRELRIFNENIDWLRERWDRADDERAAGDLRTIKPWHFDDVTDRQLARIDEIGLRIKGARLTKGRASDIIGLYEPIESEHAEILRFFKIPLKGFNQSRAREEVSKLLATKESREAWENRPATECQKEFYRTFDYSIPNGLTHKCASDFISDKEAELLSRDEKKFREWEEYETIYGELSDPEARADYGIKKVSVKDLREAVISLLEDGNQIEELSIDVQLVVDRLIERNPRLYREPT